MIGNLGTRAYFAWIYSRKLNKVEMCPNSSVLRSEKIMSFLFLEQLNAYSKNPENATRKVSKTLFIQVKSSILTKIALTSFIVSTILYISSLWTDGFLYSVLQKI